MGNLQSYIDTAIIHAMDFTNGTDSKTDNKDNLEELDKYTKTQIFEHIKKMKTKNMDVDNTFADKIKDVTLDNQNLMAMYIELYEKLFKVLEEKKIDHSKTKKIFYVKPAFDSGKVTDSLKESNGEQKKFTLGQI